MACPFSSFEMMIDVLIFTSFDYRDYVGALNGRQVHYASICTHRYLVIVQARMQCGMESNTNV